MCTFPQRFCTPNLFARVFLVMRLIEQDCRKRGKKRFSHSMAPFPGTASGMEMDAEKPHATSSSSLLSSAPTEPAHPQETVTIGVPLPQTSTGFPPPPQYPPTGPVPYPSYYAPPFQVPAFNYFGRIIPGVFSGPAMDQYAGQPLTLTTDNYPRPVGTRVVRLCECRVY